MKSNSYHYQLHDFKMKLFENQEILRVKSKKLT